MRIALLVLGVLAGAAVPAQDQAWRLPERGAAEYRRTLTLKSDISPKRSTVDDLECTGKMPTAYWPHLYPAPWVCEGEIAADRQRLRDPAFDPVDVLRAVAMDLGISGRTRLRFPRVVPFGDLVVTGRADRIGEDGSQAFDLVIKTDEPRVLPDEDKAEMRRFVEPLCKFPAQGRVRVERVYDADSGVVRSFRGELSLWFEEKEDQWRKLVYADNWELVAVHENQDAAFRGAVAKAIRAGAEWLKKELSRFDRAHLKDRDKNRSYGSGRIALGLLTMLHAEVPAADPVIVRGFEELARRELVDTYSLGIALMALEARYAPPGEADLIRSGVLGAPRPRTLSPADKELAMRWLSTLRNNIDTRVDRAYRLRFNYVRGRRWDNSVNQYGLLGLHAASLCQLDVPVTLWRAAAEHLLEVQCEGEGTRRLDLTSYRELRPAASDRRGTRASGPKTDERGYTYYGPGSRPAYGSMVTAGMTGLALARAGLVRAGLTKADVLPRVEDALNSSFAWLDANFSVRANPGFVGRAESNWYYYLYGLERACELSGIARIGGRDWFYEGALQLMSHQQKNGTFRPDVAGGRAIDSTCFAILFLKKATLPAITIK